MAREKSNRKLNFKPIIKKYGAKDIQSTDIIHLLHEEIEAIYLMDQLGLYQEDAAKKMEVSRPTFSRIIKNARIKIANALVTGADLIIEDTKEDYIVAVCTDDMFEFYTCNGRQAHILVYSVKKGHDPVLEKRIGNPVYFEQKKPAMTIPDILLEEGVNFYIGHEIGLGLEGALMKKGIFPMVKEKINLEIISKIVQ